MGISGEKTMTDAIVIFTACASEDEALRIANATGRGTLAACVNILSPVRSIYRWERKDL